MNNQRSVQPDVRPDDPRLLAFVAYLQSADRRDAKAGVEAIRELRALGISVCPLAPKPLGANLR